MAITGRFDADFSSFYAAVQQADVALKGFEQGAGKVETSLTRMTNSLSGTKVIQDAALMTEAVTRIGGVSKLTETELARLSVTATEAAAKMRAMGIDVPPGLQRIADATTATHVATTNWSSALGQVNGLLAGFGLALSAAGLVRFVGNVFEAASTIHDMGEKLGISAEAVQGFKFAATQAGSSLDAVGIAINKMNANLSEGDKSTVEALKKAHLEFATIRSMTPENAFLAIADAIQKIPDPMTQSDVALKVFGKSAAELLPAIKEGFRAASDGAAKMSNDTIRELEAAQDAWTALGNKVTIVTGGIIAATIEAVGTVKARLGELSAANQQLVGMGLGPATSASLMFLAATDQLGTSTKKLTADIELLPPALHKTKTELEEEEKAFKAHEASMEKLDKEYRAFRNDIGVREIEDRKIEIEAQKKLDEAYRQFRNENAVRMMEADAAKMKADEANHAAHLAVLLGQDAAYTAGRAALAASITTSGSGIWTSDMAVPAAAKSPNVWTSDMGGGAAPADPYAVLHRAGGGAVSSGVAYMVGERGPELYTPGANGFITPNGGGGTTVVNNTIYVNGTAEDVARQVMAEITKTMKVGRKWPAN